MHPSRGPRTASGDRPSVGHGDRDGRLGLSGGGGSPRDAARDASCADNDPSSTSVRGNRAGRSKRARRTPKPRNVLDGKRLARPEPSRPGSGTGQNRPVMARSSRWDVEVLCWTDTQTPAALNGRGFLLAAADGHDTPFPPDPPRACGADDGGGHPTGASPENSGSR